MPHSAFPNPFFVCLHIKCTCIPGKYVRHVWKRFFIIWWFLWWRWRMLSNSFLQNLVSLFNWVKILLVWYHSIWSTSFHTHHTVQWSIKCPVDGGMDLFHSRQCYSRKSTGVININYSNLKVTVRRPACLLIEPPDKPAWHLTINNYIIYTCSFSTLTYLFKFVLYFVSRLYVFVFVIY